MTNDLESSDGLSDLDLVGQQIGTYRVLSLLGRGGTAEVYKAFHPALKREVAVKVLLREVSQDEDWVRRFRQEAELLGSLDHPHILPIYDAGEHDGRPYLVMKYMGDGATLRTQLSGQPWPLNRVVKVVVQVADALDAAHHAGVVHRDIKPSNILVTPDLRCLVFDFGIAKPFRREEVTTGSGLIVGTPEFMSPEQCKGERIDHRSDVYSLGVMSYQMLTGHVPFTAETAVGILMKHLTDPLPIPPRGVALPPTVNAVLRRAMAREPGDRFSTAGEFAQALHRSADQRATVTLHAAEIQRAATPTLRLPGWVRKLRRPEVRLGIGASALALMLVGVVALWPKTPPPAAVVHFEPIAPVDPQAAQGADSEVASPDSERSAQPSETRAASEPAPPAPVSGHELSTLEIASDLSAKVLVDGQPVGAAPGRFGSVAPGRHVVTLDAGDGRIHERTIVATAGSTHVLRFDFSRTPKDVTRAAPEADQVAASTVAPVPRGARRDVGPRIREWTGWLTDDQCGETGGKQGELHLRCAEKCIREGRQAMLYSRGKLYRLVGYEKLDVVRGQPLRFRGWLEVDTIYVADPAL